MNDEYKFMLIYMIIVSILNDNNVSREEFDKILEGEGLFRYSMFELEKKLDNSSAIPFIISLINKTYQDIRDNDDIYSRVNKWFDKCLENYKIK